MERNSYPSKHRSLYYTYNTIGFIFGVITFISFKLVPVLIAIAGIVYFKKKLDNDDAELIGIGIFWLAFFTLGSLILKYVGDFSGYFFDQAEKYKKNYSFVYGRDFKKPIPEDFGLNDKLYRSFNHYSGDWAITSIAVVLLATFIEMKMITRREPLLLITPIALGIATNLILRYICKQLKKRQPQYENVTRYEEATKIYEAIQQEIRIENLREEREKKENRRKKLMRRR